MSQPFIPASDTAFDGFLYNFSTKIAAAPAAYQLSAADAAAISSAYTLWHGAFLIAYTPQTRTHITINAKDSRRAAATAVVRTFAAMIRVNDAVSIDLKIGLGIRPAPRSYSRINPPAVSPILAITGMSVAQHTLTAVRREGETRKPQGAIALVLFRTTADAPATDPAGAHFLGLATRARFKSGFTAADSGKVATYFGRWANAKGELGPWSAPVSMRVAA